MNRLYQLAEWFGLCDFIAERDRQYKQPKEVLSSSGRSCPQKIKKTTDVMSAAHLVGIKMPLSAYAIEVWH
jgi:hypothetical protein